MPVLTRLTIRHGLELDYEATKIIQGDCGRLPEDLTYFCVPIAVHERVSLISRAMGVSPMEIGSGGFEPPTPESKSGMITTTPRPIIIPIPGVRRAVMVLPDTGTGPPQGVILHDVCPDEGHLYP